MRTFQITLLSFFLFLAKTSSCQVNILDSLPNEQLYYYVQKETAGDIFLLRASVAKISIPYWKQSVPYQFSIVKVKKQGLQEITTRAVFGDSTQADSVISEYNVRIMEDRGSLHLLYEKQFIKDTANPAWYKRIWYGIYYQRLDTNLNVIIPETRIVLNKGDSSRFIGATLAYAMVFDKKLLICYSDTDTIGIGRQLSKFIITDSMARTIRTGIIPNVPDVTMPSYSRHDIAESFYDGNGRIFFTGNGLVGQSKLDGMVVTDTTGKALDSFVMNDFPQPVGSLYHGGYTGMRNCILLPTGSLIEGGMYYGMNLAGTEDHFYTVMSKHPARLQYAMDTAIAFSGKDSADLSHSTMLNNHALSYNSSDNLVYLANTTHNNGIFGYQCTGQSNYVQIIATDTNLHTRWRKFIYSQYGRCAVVTYVTPCIGRSGILIAGFRYKTDSPRNVNAQVNFLYRIDSSTSTGIGNGDDLVIRDRFRIYPNPTTDRVTIDDFLQGINSISIYDMQGRVVQKKIVTGNPAQISLAQNPAGIYLINLSLKDGSSFTQRIVRQ